MAVELWIPCSEGTGTTAGDISGAGLDLTPGAMPDWAQDARGWALDLNGTTHYLENSSWPSANPTSAITVALWINAAAQDNQGILTHYDTGSNQRSWMVQTSNSSWSGGYTDRLGVVISQDGQLATNYKIYRSSSAVFDSAWHHVAFTFGSSTLKLYIDGQEDTGVTKVTDGSVSSLHDSTANLLLGALYVAGSPSNFYDGLVNDIEIWDAALTAAQITQVYRRRAIVHRWRAGRGDI